MVTSVVTMMQTNIYASVTQYYLDVEKFNECSGLLTDKPTWDDFEKLFGILKSEFRELEASFPLKDTVEMVDGVADVTYVIMGMLALLQKSGFDVVALLQRVASNNDQKIFKTFDEALDLLVELEHTKPSLVPYTIVETNYDGTTYFVVVDTNGKVCKRVNHIAPDIKSLVQNWNVDLEG